MDTVERPDTEALRPVSMYEITAKLFTHVSKAVIDSFGEEGLESVRKGVRILEDDLGRGLFHRSDVEVSKEQLEPSQIFTYEKLFDSKEIEQTFLNYSVAQKKAGLEPLTIYAIMAKLFAHVSKAVIEHYGEEAQEVIKEGVWTFGEERGRDIARRAAIVGEPNQMNNYLSNYDMGRSDLFEYETLFHPKEIEQTFTKCAFGDQWKKDGMGEYGILYCQMIDPSIAKGFNPNFEVVHDQYILKEGVCHFRFQMKEENESNQN